MLDPLISNHCAIFMNLLLHKPKLQRKTIRFRKLRSIDYEEFNDTIRSSLLFDEGCSDLNSLFDSLAYHSVLKSTLDAYAPEKTCCSFPSMCSLFF